MVRWIVRVLGLGVVLLAGYLTLWPVPIEPVSWDAQLNRGYIADFAPNNELSDLERIALPDHTGPEDAAFGPDGMLYIATHEGNVLKLDPVSKNVSVFAETGGRPLGIEFSRDGKLFVADAYLGLLEISETGDVKLLANKTENGSSIDYADDLDIARDGSIYFTDASTKYGAKQNGGTLPASMLDLMEHGPNGRILKYDPATGKTTVVLEGLSFANGIALTEDDSNLLVIETGNYSVSKLSLDGSSEPELIIENLPGFPDNINRNPDGTFWLGLVSPRSEVADALSDKPFLRKVVMRLPAAMRPAAQRYGFVVKIDENGSILETLQDPSGDYALTTGLIEGPDNRRYVTSLTEPDLGVLK